MDYIADWARSVHREAIIRELQKLAPSSSPLENMSDILSSVDSYRLFRNDDGVQQIRRGSWQLQTSTIQDQSDIDNPSRAIQGRLDRMASWQVAQDNPRLDSALKRDPFFKYDSSRGVVRDCNYIQSRVVGVHITDSTFDDLAKCRPKQNQSDRLLRRIRKRFEVETPLMVEQWTLYDVEAVWSGNRRDFQVHDNPQENLQVIFTVSAYVESDWSLTRELCYLAISESAKKRLHDQLSTRPMEKRKGYMMDRADMNLPITPSSTVAEIFMHFLEAPATATLAACPYRCSLQPSFEDLDDSDMIVLGRDGDRICKMNPSSQPRSRDVAWDIYLLHRVGRNVSSISFLRTSQRIDRVENPQTRRPRSNPWTTYSIVPTEKAVAVYSKNANEVSIPERARCCIYIFDRMQVSRLVKDLRLRRLSFRYCYVTERLATAKAIDWNVSRDISRGKYLRKAEGLVDHLTGTLFEDESDESEEDSDEGDTSRDSSEQLEPTESTESDDDDTGSSSNEPESD